jgi:hypothetical protein
MTISKLSTGTNRCMMAGWLDGWMAGWLDGCYDKHVSKVKIDDPKDIMLIELPHKASTLFVDVD